MHVNTTTEMQLRAWAKEGLSAIEIARKIGRPESAIRQTLSVLGVPTRGWKKTDGALANTYYADLVSLRSVSAVAEKHGVSRQDVAYVLKQARLPASYVAMLENELKSRANATAESPMSQGPHGSW